jgi:hypothetical protein
LRRMLALGRAPGRASQQLTANSPGNSHQIVWLDGTPWSKAISAALAAQ